jgi:hypothetical protein
MRNHYIRLAELVQEGVTEDLSEFFRRSEQHLDLDAAVEQITEIRNSHQQKATELWQAHGLTAEMQEVSARADLAGFLAACMTGGAREFRDTALEALQVLGRQGDADIVRALARRR